jgi:hypothetical protein
LLDACVSFLRIPPQPWLSHPVWILLSAFFLAVGNPYVLVDDTNWRALLQYAILIPFACSLH